MQEQFRQRVRPTGPGPGGGFFDEPDVPTGTALVTHGTFAEDLPVAQMTVAQVRRDFDDRLNIHPEAIALLNGVPVGEDATVQAGQTLMFVRPSGEKGRRCR
jgi:hypothetical protein